jgi:RNase P subunit RPR2
MMAQYPKHRLMVMRLKDMTYTHQDQDNSYFCSKCHHQVGIYPSGMKVIKGNPNVEIICQVCAFKDRTPTAIISAPGAIEEAIKNYNQRKKQ